MGSIKSPHQAPELISRTVQQLRHIHTTAMDVHTWLLRTPSLHTILAWTLSQRTDLSQPPCQSQSLDQPLKPSQRQRYHPVRPGTSSHPFAHPKALLEVDTTLIFLHMKLPLVPFGSVDFLAPVITNSCSTSSTH